MKRYRVTRTLPYQPEVVWKFLAHLENFTYRDPYHHDFVFLGEQHEGLGARFRMRHSYWPIFPFPPDLVDCTVTLWEPGKQLHVLEHNARAYRSHTQEYSLVRSGQSTKVTYEVTYVGVPRYVLPWLFYVNMLVLRRMRQKLRDAETWCQEFIAKS